MQEVSFDERGQRVMVLAEENAKRLGNNYIDTEHILFGIYILISEEDGGLFRDAISELQLIPGAIEFVVNRKTRGLDQDGLTPRSLRVIDYARGEARLAGHDAISPEDLLAGMMREAEGVGAGILQSLGFTYEKARAAIEARQATKSA